MSMPIKSERDNVIEVESEPSDLID